MAAQEVLAVTYEKLCHFQKVEGLGYEISFEWAARRPLRCEIGEHRPNAIAVIGRFLKQLVGEQVDFSLVSIDGGQAIMSSVPTERPYWLWRDLPKNALWNAFGNS